MKIFDFNKYFPDEAACRRKFKEMRDKEGVTCQHCSSNDVVWLESKQQYKFNRRYFGEDLFDRLVMIAASYRTDFEHRTYRKAA